jgi:hypothetical protein
MPRPEADPYSEIATLGSRNRQEKVPAQQRLPIVVRVSDIVFAISHFELNTRRAETVKLGQRSPQIEKILTQQSTFRKDSTA